MNICPQFYFRIKIVHKVATRYIPYQLVYGLHPLMPIQYVLLVISANHKYVKPTKILTAKITKMEKLQENKWEAQNNVGEN